MGWSPHLYLKFDDERTRPARDLLAQVQLESVTTAVDLGCGPGNSTELIVARYGPAGVSGMDSDMNMLAAARKRLPGIVFVEGDLATWQPREPADLLFANAVFQWLPNHLDIFDRLIDGLKPGGVLAVQMPDNLSEPSHLLMEETSHSGPWRDTFSKDSARRGSLASPATYYERLAPECSRVDIWHTIYNHPLENAAAIVEWLKASGLRPYLDKVMQPHREAFTTDYLARITQAYPPMADGRVLLRFPRLFIVAVK